MDKAIITGATGLVGASVVKYLSSLGVQLLCLGRKNINEQEWNACFGKRSKYITLPMRDITALPEHLRKVGLNSFEDAVFYNFAWSGKSSLADGTLSDQIKNAIWSAEAVRVAKVMGCVKFINSGSMEETFIDAFTNSRGKLPYESTQLDYGIAKLAARDMCKMVAYIEGIDYIHTRMSVPLDASLSKGGYIASTIKKILKRQSHVAPQSRSLYDLVVLEDVAHAYYVIGTNGVNKADYYIGNGEPATLRQHFDRFNHLISCQCYTEQEPDKFGDVHFFDVRPLREDTGFSASLRFEDIIRAEVKK